MTCLASFLSWLVLFLSIYTTWRCQIIQIYHFQPTTLYLEGQKPSEYCTLLLPMAEIKPGLPAQQASATSLTPLPLSLIKEKMQKGTLPSRSIFSIKSEVSPKCRLG